MTSNSPEEDVFHFRGKTLTPESPRPVHMSKPANIPVLQNQMDPSFNDTSKYQTTQAETQQSTFNVDPAVRDQLLLARQFPSQTYPVLGEDYGDLNTGEQDTGGREDGQSVETGGQEKNNNESTFSAVHSAALSNQYYSPLLHSSLHETVKHDPSLPLPTTTHESEPNPQLDQSTSFKGSPDERDSFSAPLSDKQTTQDSGQSASKNPTDYAPAPGEKFDNNLANLAAPAAADANYQKFFDTFSSPTSTAAAPLAAAATSPVDGFLNSSKSMQSATGLPPRPPPQENKSTQPNYAASDGINLFHNAHNQPMNGTADYQSNYHESNEPQPGVVPVNAPGTKSGPNDLPPPPIATFQQSAHSPNAIQSTEHRFDDPNLKSLASDGQEESPWGPEVQREYDEFLHNERIYVTEGVWDRFPAGARLFVGKCYSLAT